MSLANNQRKALIEERGKPSFSLEFDVFEGNKVSMWTHFDHSADFEEIKKGLLAIKNHLDEFLRDENMCPFRKKGGNEL